MLLGIDHLVIAVIDPDQAALELEREFGLRARGGGRHDALGTFNRLVWLGDSYLELIGVFDRARAEHSWIGRPTVAKLDHGGGLVTFALASDDLGADVVELQAGGSRLGAPVPAERRRADGKTVRWRVALPPQLGPSEPPFLIEHDTASAEWTPEDRADRALEVHPIGQGVRLSSVEILVPEIAPVAHAYLRDLALRFRPSLVGGGARDSSVGRQIIRLGPIRGRGSGDWPVTAIRLLGPPAERLTADLLGCRWFIGPG